MVFEDLYRLLDVRDGPHASLEDIYKQYYALKHLYQTSNRQDIPEVCRAMKDAVAILTDPGSRAAYDAAFLSYRMELTPLWALDGFDDIQHYQKSSTAVQSSITMLDFTYMDYPNLQFRQIQERPHPTSEVPLPELKNEKVHKIETPGDAPAKIKTPWGSRKNLKGTQTDVASESFGSFVQYTSEDYRTHADWSDIESKKDLKRKDSTEAGTQKLKHGSKTKKDEPGSD